MKSELRSGIDKVIKLVSILMVPTAILLVTAQLDTHEGVVEAIQASVAGLVAMVPEGLVLLTSIAFAVGATRLASKKVLTQELAAIEGLARVDVICLDKTGTLTEGSLSLGTIEHLGGHGPTPDGEVDAAAVLGALGASDDHPNPSLAAIVAEFPAPEGWVLTEAVPFSSARKWSAAAFDGQGAWYLGAPDILLDRAEPGPGVDAARQRLDHYAQRGRRVLLLAAAPPASPARSSPPVCSPRRWWCSTSRSARPPPTPSPTSASRASPSRSSPATARSPSAPSPVGSACRVPTTPSTPAPCPRTQDELAEILETHSVFGRVTPHQKRAMVHALQSRGHTVAMTGDGVNDTLALKDADIGVAMGSGSAAARAVARFVLLDNDFSVFPSVVAEGRRVIANVERVANLFLTKTFYAMLLALATGVGRLPFPFIPRHFTLISALTIGIPGFFLALAPNHRRARSGFLPRVLRFAIPAGVVAAATTFASFQMARSQDDVDAVQARTIAVITLFLVAMWVLVILSRPLNVWRIGLIVAMVALFVGALTIPWFADYFDLDLPSAVVVEAAVGIAAIGAAVLELGWRLAGWSRVLAPEDD